MDNVDVAALPHYQASKIQPIEYMLSEFSPDEFRGMLKGCLLKYILRYQKKAGTEDLLKAQVYLNWLLQFETTGKIIVKKSGEKRND